MKKLVAYIGAFVVLVGGLTACDSVQLQHRQSKSAPASVSVSAKTVSSFSPSKKVTVPTVTKTTQITTETTLSTSEMASATTTTIASFAITQRQETVTIKTNRPMTTTTQHRHTWSEWEEIKAATAGTNGEKVRFCCVCGQEEKAIINKLIPRFEKPIGTFESENVYFLYQQIGDWVNYECAAQTLYYTLKRDNAIEVTIKEKFKETFGFSPTAEVKFEWVGQHMLDGYDIPQEVYCYKLFDTTYPLLDNEMNEVYHQVCADGSPWVGYCVYADVWVEDTQQPIYRELQQQMLDEFVEVTGKTMDELENDDSYFISNASEATVRTREGTLVDVVYIYCRGIDYTWGPQSKPENIS